MIYLMRHGLDNEKFVGGWSDVPLTPKGVEQVKKTATWIKENLKIDNIYSSDITRAKQTANIVSQYLKIEPIYIKELREQNKGDLNGKRKDKLTNYEKKLIYNQKINTTFPNGESLIDLYNRIYIFLNKIENIEGNDLYITHRGVINMIYYIKEEIKLDIEKSRFNVEHASVHVLNKKIRRLY